MLLHGSDPFVELAEQDLVALLHELHSRGQVIVLLLEESEFFLVHFLQISRII